MQADSYSYRKRIKTISPLDLRKRLGFYWGDASRGQPFLIVYKGQAVAALVPADMQTGLGITPVEQAKLDAVADLDLDTVRQLAELEPTLRRLFKI